MTGVDIIGDLLRADAGLIAIVPVDRIKAGQLPDNVALPALLVRLVSSIERLTLTRGSIVRATDRISVTVRAGNYRDQGAVIGMARSICAGRIGAVGGGTDVAILNAGTGPDVLGPANSFEQTIDFRVTFNTPA
jgi:hypothetical protein